MDWYLLGYWLPILTGVLIASPFGAKLGDSLGADENRLKWMTTIRGRKLGGLLLICIGGFAVSAHTMWFHNKFHELGNQGVGCASFGVFDCASVIANDDYNTIFGIPWGMVGMLAFTFLSWCALAVQKDPMAKWVELLLKGGTYASGFGILIALYLVYVEIVPLEGVFCQYCSTAHLADLFAFIIFFSLLKMKNEGEWAPDITAASANARDGSTSQQRRAKRGYVKPILAEEE